MKKISLFLLIFVFGVVLINAEESEHVEIPEGMEVIQSGTVKIIVPQGAKINQKGGLITVEDIGAYVGRRFLDVENSLAELKANEEKFEKEINRLKKELQEIRADLDRLSPTETEEMEE